MITFPILAFLSSAAPLFDGKPISYYIDELGYSDASAQLEKIDDFGCEGVGELVKNLSVVPSGRYYPEKLTPKIQKQIYLIASLRMITENDFYATKKRGDLSTYDGAGRQFITEGAPRGTIKYFGWWPSHGIFYLSPKHVQAEIIEKWKSYSNKDVCRRSSDEWRMRSSFYLSGNKP